MTIIDTYSRLASCYESAENLSSLWGKVTQAAMTELKISDSAKVIVDVGCGPGIQLASLIEAYGAERRFIGVEPAENLRRTASERIHGAANAAIVDGRFEHLPLDTQSVDYLYSILAFHWTSDVTGSVDEIARVLKPDGEMDLFFIGKDTGKEFIKAISPTYFKHLSPRQIMDMASQRQRLTEKSCNTAFGGKFGARQVSVTETVTTYYDSLEGHWSWWCRIEGQFDHLPPDKRKECDSSAREAIASLTTEMGIPYTVQLLHVRVSNSLTGG